ncbi:pyrimidine utilization protein D [Roseateles aquatilis]|uniref:Putative carbamate hydrolase RutD n=1 Tax=Roseateles aquatilis TaxID=431061 RepID=A0A246JDT7_9BURK|nr:pyrimidine utilization protein D [Roseateles aquatilis]OWQ90740.1 pyrimidine utilization protein D [Roseateles aquatilis]
MSLHYEVHGPARADGPSVLLSSGLGGSATYWKHQLDVLVAAGRRVIVYDQRGTGRSPAELPGDYAIADMAQDVEHILDDSDTRTCHLVGHALGGLVGLQLALDHPDRIGSLTLINAWAAPNPHTARCFDARLALLDARGPAAYVAAQPLFLYPAAWALANADLVDEEVAHAIAHFPGAANMHARIGALRAFDVAARLHQVGCPVLVMAAQDDILVPWTQSSLLARGLPHATLACMPHGGHAHNVTAPQAFNRGLLAFLDRLDRLDHLDR